MGCAFSAASKPDAKAASAGLPPQPQPQDAARPDKHTHARSAATATAQPTDSVWLTSNGIETEALETQFVHLLLARRGVEYDASMNGAELVKVHAAALAELKVLVINDSIYHRPKERMDKARADGPSGFWDLKFPACAGIKRENITVVQGFRKPWLFGCAEVEGQCDSCEPPPEGQVDAADRAKYFEALQATQDAYDASVAGAPLPTLPSGLNQADALCAASHALDTKYTALLDTWLAANVLSADVIAGAGGEIVLVNLMYVANQPLATSIADRVRSGRALYIGRSAGTMTASKSMELTGDLKHAPLRAFGPSARYLVSTHHSVSDTNNEGVDTRVLGGLPLINSPLAMRPHMCTATWSAAVAAENRAAEDDFEQETGLEMPDHLAPRSGASAAAALEMLNVIGRGRAAAAVDAPGEAQDHPVFVALFDRQVIACKFVGERRQEQFRLLDSA